jgi:hypothetical protein
VNRLTVIDSVLLKEILIDLEKHKAKHSKARHQVKETFFKKEYYLEFLDHDEAFKACIYLLASKKRYLLKYRISFVHEKNRLYLVYVPPEILAQ